MDNNFEKYGVKAHVWYWTQCVIYPMIRSTDGCVYCIFLRGAVFGITIATLIGGGLWLTTK